MSQSKSIDEAPRAVIIAGPNGSGKATIAREYLQMNRDTTSQQRMALHATADVFVCARHGTERAGWESPCQVIAEPKARP
jgi:predicted ABC-type ATPase